MTALAMSRSYLQDLVALIGARARLLLVRMRASGFVQNVIFPLVRMRAS